MDPNALSSPSSTTTPSPRKAFWQVLWLELRSWLLVLVPFFLITTFGVTITGVDGNSMMPSLRQGERILIPKYETWLHRMGMGSFRRGDIVVFKPPADAPGAEHSVLGLWNYTPYFIKRVIAVAGDTVRLERGEVFVNGTRLAQGFITDFWREQGCWDRRSSLANNAENTYYEDPINRSFTVPTGHYYVMGDNRSRGGSEDSRMLGPIPLEAISGRAALVWWPMTRLERAEVNCATRTVQRSGATRPNPRLLPAPAGWNP